MNKRRLGKSDIEITPIGLGCWQFSQGNGIAGRTWENLPQDSVTEIVSVALKGGISWFDTAEMYGRGQSERALASALTRLGVKPGSVTVATKWFPIFRTAHSLESTIGTRLACLDPYPIDLYQIHQPWSFSPIPKQMHEMAKLLKAGKIRTVGISNFSAKQMQIAYDALAAEGVTLVSNQVRFNLLDRSIERNGILEAARKLGVTIIAWSPLAQGVLTGRFHDDPSLAKKVSGMRRMAGHLGPAGLERSRPLVDELRAVARAHGATVSQIALAWEVSFHGETVVAIPGATRPAQAEQSAGALAIRLSSAELARIDEKSRAAAKG
jgi:aryl-alcohol dehydrogenase-like predicted oxidoreductase